MYSYHFHEWLSFFYFYCIFGWCFESAYVSLKNRRPVNRGFLHGPWLPLYGSGAILVLWLTLPFQNYPALVYLVGALGATVLEYATGEAMVRIFKVRYWDYSNQRFQYKGHICLSSTIAWGFLSLLMVYVVHRPVEQFIFWLNEDVVSVLTFAVTACMAYDFSNALRNALDLRDVLIQAEQVCVDLEKRASEKKRLLEAATTFTKAAVEEAMDVKKEALMKSADARKEAFLQSREALEDRAAAMMETQQLEEKLEQLKERMVKSAEHLLLSNPGSRFMTMADNAAEIQERLKNLRSGRKQ